ncbi:MAG: DUF3291 domain-containing protein [Marinicaulis sp.]|nr:DUF3291 domain-containing protein [Marinicaulis sp.]NNL88337.1 DUF3291 domain-containing protein [Marinicaulis sp.]
MPAYQLAQINIARLKAPEGDPSNAVFFDNLDRINELAEASPGFVWRLKDESGNATGISAFDDPLVIVNMSVWDSVADLKAFAFNSAHVEIFKRRAEFFEPMEAPHAVLWWVAAGHYPSLDEAKAKLEHLANLGPRPGAFTFAKPFDPPI